jgi:hypothetical protein
MAKVTGIGGVFLKSRARALSCPRGTRRISVSSSKAGAEQS